MTFLMQRWKNRVQGETQREKQTYNQTTTCTSAYFVVVMEEYVGYSVNLVMDLFPGICLWCCCVSDRVYLVVYNTKPSGGHQLSCLQGCFLDLY